jgi:hypothetical protein
MFTQSQLETPIIVHGRWPMTLSALSLSFLWRRHPVRHRLTAGSAIVAALTLMMLTAVGASASSIQPAFKTWRPAAGGSLSKGNSLNAKSCQKGGYLKLQSANGERFQTESACTSYAANGGKLYVIPTLVYKTTVQDDCGDGTCRVWGEISGTGLLPDSPVTVYYTSGGESRVLPAEVTENTLLDGTYWASGVTHDVFAWLCGYDITNVYATATTAQGQPIESNHVSSPCPPTSAAG